VSIKNAGWVVAIVIFLAAVVMFCNPVTRVEYVDRVEYVMTKPVVEYVDRIVTRVVTETVYVKSPMSEYQTMRDTYKELVGPILDQAGDTLSMRDTLDLLLLDDGAGALVGVEYAAAYYPELLDETLDGVVDWFIYDDNSDPEYLRSLIIEAVSATDAFETYEGIPPTPMDIEPDVYDGQTL